MTLKVAIIGYGYWGPKLARNIQNSNNFDIKFIIDTSINNLNKAKKNFPLCQFYKDYRKLNSKKVDLVVISTPTKTHFKMANHFLNKTNVLIEKPLALKLNDVVKLEKLSLRKKKKLFVDYPFIFSGSIKYLKDIINQKKYGKLLEIESFREQAPIRNDADVVWDLGVHDISILRYLLNTNPKKIKSVKYNTIKTKKKDTAYINLEYKNNLKVFIKNSWISPLKIRLIKFKFQKAIIICDENEPIYKLKVFTKKKLSSIYKLDLPEIDLSEPLFNLINYVSKSIETNKNKIFEKKFNIDVTKVLERI
ncbi:Gfo/Idh/MocA family oxidoreductase [Candidatus Pelagibacter sp.]|nr:Gfo/Idh/MocA family oxidoreductase [Candidatus Pelagibacter sp.]